MVLPRPSSPLLAGGLEKLGDGYEEARELFDRVATGEEFVEFLTLPAYELLV